MRSILLRDAGNLIKRSVRETLKRKESLFPGTNLINTEMIKKGLFEQLIASLEVHKDGRVKRHCDYTGIEISWTTGLRGRPLPSDVV